MTCDCPHSPSFTHSRPSARALRQPSARGQPRGHSRRPEKLPLPRVPRAGPGGREPKSLRSHCPFRSRRGRPMQGDAATPTEAPGLPPPPPPPLHSPDLCPTGPDTEAEADVPLPSWVSLPATQPKPSRGAAGRGRCSQGTPGVPASGTSERPRGQTVHPGVAPPLAPALQTQMEWTLGGGGRRLRPFEVQAPVSCPSPLEWPPVPGPTMDGPEPRAPEPDAWAQTLLPPGRQGPRPRVMPATAQGGVPTADAHGARSAGAA